MDQILINISTPEWWFTGIFFVLIGIILTRASSSWLPKLWGIVSVHAPAMANRVSRWNRKRFLLRIKSSRQSDAHVTWLIGRYWSTFIVFVIYTGFVGFYFALSPDIALFKKDKISTLTALAPVYVLGIILGREKNYIFNLINENTKWKKRITKR